jgi:hypothetical protein
LSKTPRPETPLDEKLVATLVRGGLEPTIVGPLEPQVAKSLRHRLYRERRKMQKLHHPDVHIANQVSVTLTAAENHLGYLNVVVYPANHHIEAALANVGIHSNDPPPLDD